MKIAPLLLALSLICNVALATVYIKRLTPSKETQASGVKTPEASQARPSANFDAADRALVDQLRAEGYPPGIKRIIIATKLDKEFAARRAALHSNKPYWASDFNPNHDGQSVAPQFRDALRIVNKEYNDALIELLGDDANATISEFAKYHRTAEYGNLSEAKISQIQDIRNDYNEVRSQLNNAIKGIRFPDDKEQLALLDKEQRADMAKVLTPEELYAYDLRNGPVAQKVQAQVQNLDITEEEYKNIYAAQETYDTKYTDATLTPVQSRVLREELMKAVLSPEQFAEYAVKTSGSYRGVQTLVETYKLPATTTALVINTQREITAQADAIQRDETLAPDARTAKLNALDRQASSIIEPALGQDAYSNYKVSNEGAWIGRLVTSPAPKKPTKKN